jgi:NADH:ubiquinone oxidoreductase subunit 6 (subunit J)
MSRLPRNKVGFYEWLNQSAIGFYKLQERHAFFSLCLTVLFVGVIAAWTFYQDFEQGGGFMTFVFAVIVFLLFAIAFYSDWEYAKNQKQNHKRMILFWKPWIFACLFPIVLVASKIGQEHRDSTYNSQIEATKQFYYGVTNQDYQIIGQLRLYVKGLPTKMSYAKMMGYYEMTNYTILTNSISLTNTTEHLLLFYGSHPILDYFQMNRINQKAKTDKPVSFGIAYGKSDTYSSDLAKQLGQVFIASGYNVWVYSVTNKIRKGLTILSKNFPDEPLQSGYKQSCLELNLNGSWTKESMFDATDIVMTVNVSPLK